MHNIYRTILVRLIKSTRFHLFCLILGILAFKSQRSIQRGVWETAYHLDAVQIYYSMLNSTLMTLYALPFYLVMTYIVLDILSLPAAMLKFERSNAWWQAKWNGMLYIAMFLAVCMNLGLIASVLLSRDWSELHIQFVEAVFLAILIQTTVLLIAGTMFQIGLIYFGRAHISLILTLCLCYLLHAIKSLIKIHWTLPDEWMTLTPLYPVQDEMSNVWFVLTVLCGVCFLTWWTGRALTFRVDALRGQPS